MTMAIVAQAHTILQAITTIPTIAAAHIRHLQATGSRATITATTLAASKATIIIATTTIVTALINLQAITIPATTIPIVAAVRISHPQAIGW